ncbi:MAG TPA: homoserine dehydrogenase [Vicinamibacterales bacterium]|nr:homoserine dehydrogenase [Vicinamibacterales bacterium]
MGLNSFQTSGNSPGSSRCRVGLVGAGALGLAIARRLTAADSPSSLHLTHISDRRARDKQPRVAETLAALTWTERFDDLLTSDVDVIVEAVSASEPASDYVRAALLAGKSVVATSKLVMAHHGPALLGLAERQGRQLRFGAAIGGALPIVRLLADGLAGEGARVIDATLSGAANAVMSRMDEVGCDIDEAVADACARGYADADPTLDLNGADAAAKLAVMCAFAFGLRVAPAQVETRSAERIRPENFRKARLRQGTIRHVAHAEYDRERGALAAWVAPLFVPQASLFGVTTGPRIAVRIVGSHAGEVTAAGIGAGVEASAVGVISDLVAIGRDRAAIVPAPVLVDPRQVSGISDLQLAEAV